MKENWVEQFCYEFSVLKSVYGLRVDNLEMQYLILLSFALADRE